MLFRHAYVRQQPPDNHAYIWWLFRYASSCETRPSAVDIAVSHISVCCTCIIFCCWQRNRICTLCLRINVTLFTDHMRSGMVYNLGRVCLCVFMYAGLSDDNFRKPWRRTFIFAHPVHLQGIRVQVRIWRSSGQGQGHRSQTGRKFLFPQSKTRSAITPA